ncbi:MAG: hypothetical protein ABIN94_20690 [Ferruginibacter sp.]
MKNISRKNAVEICWLAFSLVLAIIFSFLLFGSASLTGDLDLHLHDTYIVISRWLILVPVFLMLTFSIYFIKGIWLKLTSTFANWVIVVTGISLITMLTVLIKTFSQILVNGWTLYPPLSAFEPGKVAELTSVPQMTIIANFLTLIQAVVLGMSLLSVYRWGKQQSNDGV